MQINSNHVINIKSNMVYIFLGKLIIRIFDVQLIKAVT